MVTKLSIADDENSKVTLIVQPLQTLFKNSRDEVVDYCRCVLSCYRAYRAVICIEGQLIPGITLFNQVINTAATSNAMHNVADVLCALRTL